MPRRSCDDPEGGSNRHAMTMALLRGASVAMVLATSACDPAPRDQVLHVRLKITAHREAKDDGLPGPDRDDSAIGATFDLEAQVPVRASPRGQPFVLAPSAALAPTFAGGGHLTEKTDWMNVDASARVRTDMAASWPAGTPATAPGAALRANVTTSSSNGWEAEVDADLRLAGRSEEFRTGYGHGWQASPQSPWQDCNLSTTQARCTIRLHLLAEGAIPSQPTPGDPSVPVLDPPIRWQRDIPGLKVRRTSDGYVVANADSMVQHPGAGSVDVIHVDLWTSAPGDTRQPATAP